MEGQKTDLFAAKLLEWSDLNRREFPWRKRLSAYRVLVAEQLLRKTSAIQVKAVYAKFLRRFTGPMKLAQADPGEIQEVIRPLGMEKRRSITLHRFGVEVADRFHGNTPLSRDELVTLPGVGDYAADAVRSLVAGDRLPMVDRNAVRVISRVFSLRLPPNYRKAVTRTRDFMLAHEFGGAPFNFALLDFAATVCTSRNPKCSTCTMRRFCDCARRRT